VAVPHSASTYRDERRAHWDRVALGRPPSFAGRAYHRRLAAVHRFLIPPGQRVLELGSGDGRLLAALEPRRGVGVDFSPAMLAAARRRHPELELVESDVHELEPGMLGGEPFDAIVLSDLVNDLWDVQRVFERVAGLARPSTRIVLSFYSHLWQGPLRAAETLRLKRPVLEQSWLTVADVRNLLDLADFEVLRRGAGDFGNFFFGADGRGLSQDILDNGFGSGFDPAFEQHRVGPGGHVLQTFIDDGLGQHGGGGGAITGDVVSLGGGFLEELRAHVLERIFQFDLFGDGDAIVGHGRCAEFLVERDIAALRPQGGADGVGQFVDAALQAGARIFLKY